MRIATYTRISTDEEQQPYSLEAQADRLSAFIKSQDGWELRRRFTDQMTGSTVDRPGLQQALDAGRLGAFDLLLVYRVDRLSRSVRGLAQVLEELDRAHVAFRSATEPFDTATPAGRMMVQMLGVFAEFERATLIDRTIAGMERKAATGKWCGGTRPFGYQVNSTTGFLEIKDDEAPLVSKIFELYLRSRKGARAIADILNAEGHRTQRGRAWGHKAVLQLLRNRAYIGEIFYRGRNHQAPHTPLIERDLFDSVQAVLDQREADFALRASNPSEFMLTGKVVCSKCGQRYVGTAAHGRHAKYHYYTCFTRNLRGRRTCDGELLAARALEQAVLDQMLIIFGDSRLIRDAIDQSLADADRDLPGQQEELGTVRARIGRLEDAKERYFRAFEDGSLSSALCSERITTLSAELSELQGRASELEYAVDRTSRRAPTPQDVEAIRRSLRDAIESASPEMSKRVFQALVHEVRVVSRDEIVPSYRFAIVAGGRIRV